MGECGPCPDSGFFHWDVRVEVSNVERCQAVVGESQGVFQFVYWVYSVVYVVFGSGASCLISLVNGPANL